MILLVGGPPRCGKTSLARLITEHDAVPYLSTDALVGVLQDVAPAVGINYENQEHQPWLAVDALNSLLGFFTYTGDQPYLLEGVVVTPEFAVAARESGRAVRAVFLGDQGMTETRLRIDPGWTAELDQSELPSLAAHLRAASRRIHERCQAMGQVYLDTGADRTAALAAARAVLTGPC